MTGSSHTSNTRLQRQVSSFCFRLLAMETTKYNSHSYFAACEVTRYKCTSLTRGSGYQNNYRHWSDRCLCSYASAIATTAKCQNVLSSTNSPLKWGHLSNQETLTGPKVARLEESHTECKSAREQLDQNEHYSSVKSSYEQIWCAGHS